LDYVQRLGPENLSTIFVVHGEETSSLAAADGFRDLGVEQVIVPHESEEFEL
jgi:hypothetical protein